MIVPRYWSESKAKTIFDGRSFTLRRFGWSDISEEDAKEHSRKRIDEALKTLKETGSVRRIDHKISYNGGEGLPIREEVVSTHGDIVISRNSYGALCLNTPDIMFADIDFDHNPPTSVYVAVFSGIAVLSALLTIYFQSWLVLGVGVLVGLFFSGSISRMINTSVNDRNGSLENKALERLKAVSARNPALHMRIYKTTMGFRILFMEQTYDPSSEATLELLRSLDSDKVYIQMCRNQRCFRARVSPKPWRIGIDRLRPRPGVWPVKSEYLSEREAWIDRYNDKSKQYSICQFIQKIGSDTVNEKAEKVRKLHDELCRSDIANANIA